MKKQFWAIWDTEHKCFVTESEVGNSNSEVPILRQDGVSGVTKADLQGAIDDAGQGETWKIVKAELTLTVA